MTRVKILVGATLLCAASIASAQDAPDPAAPPPDGSAPPAVTTTGAAPGAWSQQVIDQPMTLQAGKLAVYGNVDILHFSTTVGTVTASSTAEGLDLGVGYGVSDKLTVGLAYAFSLHDFEIKGPLTLYGAFSLYNKDKLTVGASANLTLNFNGGADAMGNTTTTETLQAGLGVRYKVTNKIALYTGGSSPGNLSGALGIVNETPRAGSVLGQHLTIGLNSNAPIAFDIPIGVGLQVAPNAFVWANTSIAHIKFSNTSNAFLFADYIPLNVGFDYSVDQHLQVGAYLTLPDLENSKFDLLVFGIGARYYN